MKAGAPTPLSKLISGGQTGVDRGALDAALARGFPCGGWCPANRQAEDGPIPPRYPLAELPGADYRERTTRNVQASDGTVILHFGPLSGGTHHTLEDCRAQRKPCLLIDGLTHDPDEGAERIAMFVREHDIGILNVAGPRASEAPPARDYAFATLANLLASLGINGA